MFGLRESDIAFIIDFAQKHDVIEAIGIFGSRAAGTYGPGSDVDIVLYGERIDIALLQEAEDVLEHQSPFPFYVDIVHWDQVQDPVFRAQIQKHVQMIYRKETT